MTFRLIIGVCLTALTTASSSADLIFNLRPVQVVNSTTGFIDLVVESDSSDAFDSFIYEINISPVGGAPSGGLFFDAPVIDEATNPDYVFFGDSSFVVSNREDANQTVRGGDFTLSGANFPLEAADGQRLVVRAELGFQAGLNSGETYSISLSQTEFRVGATDLLAGSSDVDFTLGPPVSFTFGSAAAAVPEPSSVAALLMIVGGAVYRRRRRQR
ncbi:MAG: PEP-CTERM sorting domain-containing protein [Fuerstiella sp.]